jgi:hypothetical protein
MPKNIETFFQDNFNIILIFALVWVCGWMAYGLWRRSRRGPHFPRLDEVMVVFREDFVSSRPLKSSGARGVWASGSLIVIVTSDELWVTTCFPFTAISGFDDFEYRIPLDAITNVQRDGKWFYLDFTRGDGSPRRIALRIRKGDYFLAALGKQA